VSAGVSSAVIPATYKKKRVAVTAPKVADEEGEKPTATPEGDEAQPSLGRGER